METDGDFHADGNVIAYSTSVSDERVKENIEVVTDAVAKVQKLRGVEFDFIVDGKRSAGVIAQDVEKVLPQAVIEKKAYILKGVEDYYKVVEYSQLTSLFIEAIKEQQAQIEDLKAEVSKLKRN
jgi:hypothetical protein